MPRAKLVGTDFSDYFTEPEQAREGYQQVFAKGFVTDYPLTIRHKDGRLNAGHPIRTRHADWSSLPRDLGVFDVVLVADVLYEPRYPAMVATAIERLMTPGGQALVAHPGRLAFPDFLAECATRGLVVTDEDVREFQSGEIHQTITIYRIERAGSR